MMEAIEEIVRQYGLEEENEYIIVPFLDRNGRKKRVFLLKRSYMRVRYPDEHVVDYPLQEIIEATVKFPESPLSEVMHLFHKETPVEEASMLNESGAPDADEQQTGNINDAAQPDAIEDRNSSSPEASDEEPG